MLGTWVDRLPDLAADFDNATPFPLVVIDSFLEEDVAAGLLSEFPRFELMGRSRDYVFGNKRESSRLCDAGPECRRLYEYLISDQFSAVLAQLTGRSLFIDPSFHGGGFHQGADGSFLDTHVDFNIHPQHDDWLRVLNILLYLNENWLPEFGGDLLVRSDPTAAPRSIAPLFNRCVIMLTSHQTYHGYRRMSLPPGIARRSIAGYAYERIPAGSQRVRTTSWAPEGAGVLKRTLGKYWPEIAAVRSRLLGKR